MTKEKTKRKDGFLSAGKRDSYDIHFARYEQEESLEPLRKFLREKRYKVGDSTVTYRVLSSWDSAGLLPRGVNTKGWRRFSLPEIVWLEAIKRMRDFGVTFGEITKIKDAVMIWNEKVERYAEFEYYVSKALLSSDDPYIVVQKDGADIGTTHEIERSKILLGSRDMLLISLKSILGDLGYKPVKSDNLFALSNDEKEALFAIRRGGNKSVKLKTKNKTITEVDMSWMGESLSMKDVEKLLTEKGFYGGVEIKSENGSIVGKVVNQKKRPS